MNNMPPVPSNYTNEELLAHICRYCNELPQPIAVLLDRFAGLIDENNELKRENQTLDRLIDRLEQQLKEALNGNND